MHNSLTVSLPLLDAAACSSEIERQRVALEHGWGNVPGLISACLAILPAEPGTEGSALLFECSFETDFAELISASFIASGEPLCAVLQHCAEFPSPVDARQLADYLSARARRSSAFGSDHAAPGEGEGEREREWGRRVWRLLDALNSRRAEPAAAPSEAALEARRVAVGMQEPIPGVPLVHVSWLVRGSRPRVKRALRELEHERPVTAHDARFLLDGARLVFVAYPSENAPRWSERLSRAALGPCARVWRNCRAFTRPFGALRARRERRLEEFVLEHRIPVAAWFNARARPVATIGARREI